MLPQVRCCVLKVHSARQGKPQVARQRVVGAPRGSLRAFMECPNAQRVRWVLWQIERGNPAVHIARQGDSWETQERQFARCALQAPTNLRVVTWMHVRRAQRGHFNQSLGRWPVCHAFLESTLPPQGPPRHPCARGRPVQLESMALVPKHLEPRLPAPTAMVAPTRQHQACLSV